MLEILVNWGNPFRSIAIMIDSVAYSLIDNAYNLIVTFSSGSLFNDDVISSVMNNTYIIIGIFALFRIALILVNAMINPDKLNEKGNGLGNVLANLIIMFVILIMTPIIFKEAFSLQETIVKGHYIEKIFLNVGTIEGKNPGNDMKSIAIGSLITINEKAEGSPNCNKTCHDAIDEYNKMKDKNNFEFSTLAKYIGVSVDDKIYVYNYMFIITFVCGIAITYVLLSFGIDIAIRMVELAVLEMLAPLFIATYIDPKSAKSGPFHKWLTTVGKTYVSLFIKLAILSLMLLFISLIKNNVNSNLNLNAFENLIMLFAILIFAKKAPKWIGEMVGVEGAASGLWSPKKLRENIAGYDAMKTAGAVGAAYVGNRLANRQHNKAARKAAREEIKGLEKDGKTLSRKDKRGIKRKHGATYAQMALRNAEGRTNAMVQGIKAGKESKNILSSIKDGVKLNEDFKNANAIGEKGLISKLTGTIQGKVRDVKRYAWGSGKDMQDREKAIKKTESFNKFYTSKGREGMTYNDSPINDTTFAAEYMGLGEENGFYAAEAIKREFMKNGAKDIKVSIGQDGVPTVTAQRPDGTMVSEVAGKSNPQYSKYVEEGRSLVTKEGADFVSDAFKGMQEKAIGNIISANQNIASLMSAKSEASAQAQQSAKALTDALATAGISVDITGKSAAKISAGISEELGKSGKTLSHEQVENLDGIIKNYESDQFNLNNISVQMNQYANSLKSSQSAINALIASDPKKYGNKTFDELLVIIQHEKEDTSKVLKGSSSSEDNSGK